jgi:pyrimidine-nucleoside phosphorylase
MRIYDIIRKKRDKQILSKEEIEFFINGYVKGEIPDYQASAILMAIYLNGMTNEETSLLTSAMADSGDKMDLSSIDGIIVDKHSTGGVGDKTTLIVAPIVAACGIPVAKMSGRGLGHTGGTVDKLESIPGFSTSLSSAKFISNIKEIGLSIASQSGNLAPADKKLYSLRDVTATVSSLPLIASSIMSKKIASGADKIFLDVKTGSGSFMKTLDQSIELAQEMVKLGGQLGRETVALITDMEQPLGNAVGNSIEVIEAIESLKCKGPRDLQNLCINISVAMVKMALNCKDIEAKDKVLKVLSEKKALDKFTELVKLQGGDTDIVNDYSLFKAPRISQGIYASFGGFINSMSADKIGTASMILGAGRGKKEDAVDHSAGIYLHKKIGDPVSKGDLLATIYTDRKESLAEAAGLIGSAVSYINSQPEQRQMVMAKVTAAGTILCV